MIEDFERTKKQLSELANVLNGFKSEAVQLRLLELIFADGVTPRAEASQQSKKADQKPQKRHKQAAKEDNPGDSTKRKKSPSGTGANSTLTGLVSSNFFAKPRTIG